MRRAPSRPRRAGRWAAALLLVAVPGVSAAQGPLLEGPVALALLVLAVAGLGGFAARRLLPGARRGRGTAAPATRSMRQAPISPAVRELLRRGGVAAAGTETCDTTTRDDTAGNATTPDATAGDATTRDAMAGDAMARDATTRDAMARDATASSTRTATPTAKAALASSAMAAASAEAELAVIRRLSRDVYWEQDADGVLTRVDDGPVPSPLRARIGRRRWDDGAVPLGAPGWDAHRARLERREPFSDLAWVWCDPTGRVRVALDSGLPRHDADGRFLGYAGISRDAGAETVADRARRLATAALLAAPEPVVWIEAGAGGWRVVWANAAACMLFDRTDRELRELPGAAMFGPESDGACSILEQALLARRECRLHVDLARRYGDTRSVEMRLVPLPGETALRPCAALLIHDRSAEQARLRQESRAIERLRIRMRERSIEIEAAARELESFTVTVSHDLRAPIRAVEGFARILHDEHAAGLDRIGHEHLQRILGAATRMTEMLDALLALSRLAAQPVVPETVDLSRLADSIADELRAADPGRQASIVVKPGMQVEGDRTLLRVALENLLGNAWKYTSRRSQARIEFGCTGTGPETIYHVSDDGAGFDMRFADRLFGVFQRLHNSADFPGTGVGLATVQRIVRRHGGRIWAESEPGRGARFHFTLWEKPPH